MMELHLALRILIHQHLANLEQMDTSVTSN